MKNGSDIGIMKSLEWTKEIEWKDI